MTREQVWRQFRGAVVPRDTYETLVKWIQRNRPGVPISVIVREILDAAVNGGKR